VVETRRRRVGGIGALLLAAVCITVGGYYLLRNTMGINLPELNGDAIWPILLIILGIGLLSRVAVTTPTE
jgi:hypothetical protein